MPSRKTGSSKELLEIETESALVSQNRGLHEPGKRSDEDDSELSNTDSEIDLGLLDGQTVRPRKRRKLQSNDDLEAVYFQRLQHEEEQENTQSRSLHEDNGEESSGDEDLDMADRGDPVNVDSSQDDLPVHETLQTTRSDGKEDKSKRTIFLGNVSTEAIRSNNAKKTLIRHLESALNIEQTDVPSEKIESIRFRSTAYVAGVGPKRAAFAKKELMDETMSNTNAYVVLNSEDAAARIASNLNGSVVLDRHLRVDSLAKPSKIEPRRCVFVGNLNFVDQEMVEQEGEDKTRRPKAKVPADAEEGLWRAFGKVGKVENVRVIRDNDTRIGKGFAYVQFLNENDVEAALLLDEKKFPPMLPRKLRVMRAKKTNQKASKGSDRGVSSKRRFGGQGPKLRDASGSQTNKMPGSDRNSRIVFEGYRASRDTQASTSKSKRKRSAKSNKRSSLRGAAFKAGGRQRKRDSK